MLNKNADQKLSEFFQGPFLLFFPLNNILSNYY